MTPILDTFYQRIANSQQALLVLDYDGTIAPYHTRSEEAFIAPGITERLVALHRTGHTRIIFNTGRSCDNILNIARLPFPVEVWGCHGRVHCDLEGTIRLYGLNRTNSRGLEIGHERIVKELGEDAVLLRRGCLTVFYHEATQDERDQIAAIARKCWTDLLEKHALRIDEFFGGIELNTIGRDKGDAMESILSSVNHEEIPVAFLGDAPTDEDGFRAMKGRGLAVLVAEEDDPESAAAIRLQPFREVLQFLDQWLVCIDEAGTPAPGS
ncbi:MAG: hypothetical protein JJU11_09120 [Candidatus Sumerlaeia bacterium]|nr:hypothetical protein [Candidatus Sumerlaeia bacterium]